MVDIFLDHVVVIIAKVNAIRHESWGVKRRNYEISLKTVNKIQYH
jgi:hypothetical protein